MKEFVLKAYGIFEAEDIDDAFLKLSEYFKRLPEGRDDEELFSHSDIEIKEKNKIQI